MYTTFTTIWKKMFFKSKFGILSLGKFPILDVTTNSGVLLFLFFYYKHTIFIGLIFNQILKNQIISLLKNKLISEYNVQLSKVSEHSQT